MIWIQAKWAKSGVSARSFRGIWNSQPVEQRLSEGVFTRFSISAGLLLLPCWPAPLNAHLAPSRQLQLGGSLYSISGPMKHSDRGAGRTPPAVPWSYRGLLARRRGQMISIIVFPVCLLSVLGCWLSGPSAMHVVSGYSWRPPNVPSCIMHRVRDREGNGMLGDSETLRHPATTRSPGEPVLLGCRWRIGARLRRRVSDPAIAACQQGSLCGPLFWP